jgi:hypothetical protein
MRVLLYWNRVIPGNNFDEIIPQILHLCNDEINLIDEETINSILTQIKENICHNITDDNIYIKYSDKLYIFNRFNQDLINLIEPLLFDENKNRLCENIFNISTIDDRFLDKKYYSIIKRTVMFGDNSIIQSNNFKYWECLYIDKDKIIEDFIPL